MNLSESIDYPTMERRRKVLGRDHLISTVRKFFDSNFASQKSAKMPFSKADCLISGLGIFLFKYPSLLSYDGAAGFPKAAENLKQLFNVHHLPSDTALRSNLDEIDPADIKPLFKILFNEWRRNSDTSDYRLSDGSFLISIDGTQTFSSKKIHCKSCLVKNHRNGTKTYSHQMMSAVVISPKNKAVIPIACEEISKRDGSNKNDCELNAGHRLLRNIKRNYPNTKFTVTADGLSSNTPNVKLMEELGFNYILVAKDTNHKFLATNHQEKIERDALEVFDYVDGKNVKHVVIADESTELNEANKTIVNYLCYWTENLKGEQTYYNTWVTNLQLTTDTAFEIAKSGRTYWRIENETHNTLKNQGYSLEHNYGHGEKNLCAVFSHLTLLAFLIDQINLACPQLAIIVKAAKSKVSAWKQLVITLFSDAVSSFSDLYRITVERTGFNSS